MGIGAAAIGGLIYDKLLQQRKGLVLDFNPHEFYRRCVGGGLIRLKVPEAEAENIVARLRDVPERDDSRYEMIEAVRYMLSLKDAQLVATKKD